MAVLGGGRKTCCRLWDSGHSHDRLFRKARVKNVHGKRPVNSLITRQGKVEAERRVVHDWRDEFVDGKAFGFKKATPPSGKHQPSGRWRTKQAGEQPF
jgi:hypothetical protein